jgi:hypothetical protein
MMRGSSSARDASGGIMTGPGRMRNGSALGDAQITTRTVAPGSRAIAVISA